jgi:hypothetical protein
MEVREIFKNLARFWSSSLIGRGKGASSSENLEEKWLLHSYRPGNCGICAAGSSLLAPIRPDILRG